MREKVSIYKGFRAFGKPTTENRLHAPKAGTLPTELRLDITENSIAQRCGFVNSFLKVIASVAY